LPKKMIELEGDMFKLAEASPLLFLVVPTNCGWTREGHNVMGAGVARLAAHDDPSLPMWYGAWCKQFADDPNGVPVVSRGRFILFPTKPLNRNAPWLSWQRKSDLVTIERSLQSLRRWKRPEGNKDIKILMPLVGCGSGGLKEAQVMPLLRKYWQNRFRLVRKPAGYKPPPGVYKPWPRRR